jgi:restriction system protein
LIIVIIVTVLVLVAVLFIRAYISWKKSEEERFRRLDEEVSRHNIPKTTRAQELNRKLAHVRLMRGTEFEYFVASLLDSMGFYAGVMGGAGDQGVDIIIRKGNKDIAVQCKNYAKPVGNRPVQEVYAGAAHHGCGTAWVVAPAGFTKGARELARSNGVSLFDASDLQEWIQRIDEREKNQSRGPRADLASDTADLNDPRMQPVSSQERLTVDLDVVRGARGDETTGQRHMKKHTVRVGTDTVGETVRFTAKRLGKAEVNGGAQGGGYDVTFYQLPDNTYRALLVRGSTHVLDPSNWSEVFGDQPVDYGSWTLEELRNKKSYGETFTKLMEDHPQGKKHDEKDSDQVY